MADNYLEKKMEDYLRGAQGAQRRTHISTPAGTATIKYPSIRVILTDGCSDNGREIIDTLRALRCRIAFTDPDTAAATRLAQNTGSQFHPNSTITQILQRLQAAGDPATAIITPNDKRRIIYRPDHSYIPQPASCHTPREIATFCAYALHPDSAWLWRADTTADNQPL